MIVIVRLIEICLTQNQVGFHTYWKEHWCFHDSLFIFLLNVARKSVHIQLMKEKPEKEYQPCFVALTCVKCFKEKYWFLAARQAGDSKIGTIHSAHLSGAATVRS